MIYPKLVSKLIGLQNQNCLYCKSFSQSQTKVRKIAVKIFNAEKSAMLGNRWHHLTAVGHATASKKTSHFVSDVVCTRVFLFWETAASSTETKAKQNVEKLVKHILKTLKWKEKFNNNTSYQYS